jgi:hypothetical protein
MSLLFCCCCFVNNIKLCPTLKLNNLQGFISDIRRVAFFYIMKACNIAVLLSHGMYGTPWFGKSRLSGSCLENSLVCPVLKDRHYVELLVTKMN